MNKKSRLLALQALSAAVALSLAACGGGDGDNAPAPAPSPTPAPVPVPPAPGPAPVPEPAPAPSPTPGPAPAPTPATDPVTLTGEVARNGTLQNVVVCLDLNANDACDADEPASAPTGADGRYTLTYDAATVSHAASARLIAPVKAGEPGAPTTAIDAHDPAVAATDADYLLQRPAGSAGAINPLTTLVQAGVAAGMSEEDARANVALQLAIAPAKIDNYQDDPAWDDAQVSDTARTAATLISGMLRTGVPLVVGDQNAAVTAATTLTYLSHADAGNYRVRLLERQAKAAGTLGATINDVRSGKKGSIPWPQTGEAGALYPAAYQSASGWVLCGPNVQISATIGNPSRSTSCGGSTALGWSRSVDVAGQGMADFVAERPGSFSVANAASMLAGTFPAGAQEDVRTSVVLTPDVTITDTYTRHVGSGPSTLEQVIANHPASGFAAPSPAGTLSLGYAGSMARNLRAAFTGAGTVQFYECDLNADGTIASNCAATSTGTYAIGNEGGTPTMRFAGHAPTVVNYEVIYVQLANVNGYVYRAHALKPDFSSRLSTSSRLNGAGWAAIKVKLGI